MTLSGGSRAGRIVICQGCSCERHRCREQNSLWASNWQGITWFSRARGAGGLRLFNIPVPSRLGGSWGLMRASKAQSYLFCVLSERPAFAIVSIWKSVQTFLQNSDLGAFQTALPLPGKSRLPFNGTKNIYTFNEPTKIPQPNAQLFHIFTETMTRRCRARVRLSLKSHYIVCRQCIGLAVLEMGPSVLL